MKNIPNLKKLNIKIHWYDAKQKLNRISNILEKLTNLWIMNGGSKPMKTSSFWKRNVKTRQRYFYSYKIRNNIYWTCFDAQLYVMIPISEIQMAKLLSLSITSNVINKKNIQ